MDDGSVKKPYSDARWWDEPVVEKVICNDCSHRFTHDPNDPKIFCCDAFPEGIPRSMLLRGMNDGYDLKKPCANGIVYEFNDEWRETAKHLDPKILGLDVKDNDK